MIFACLSQNASSIGILLKMLKVYLAQNAKAKPVLYLTLYPKQTKLSNGAESAKRWFVVTHGGQLNEAERNVESTVFV